MVSLEDPSAFQAGNDAHALLATEDSRTTTPTEEPFVFQVDMLQPTVDEQTLEDRLICVSDAQQTLDRYYNSVEGRALSSPDPSEPPPCPDVLPALRLPTTIDDNSVTENGSPTRLTSSISAMFNEYNALPHVLAAQSLPTAFRGGSSMLDDHVIVLVPPGGVGTYPTMNFPTEPTFSSEEMFYHPTEDIFYHPTETTSSSNELLQRQLQLLAQLTGSARAQITRREYPTETTSPANETLQRLYNGPGSRRVRFDDGETASDSTNSGDDNAGLAGVIRVMETYQQYNRALESNQRNDQTIERIDSQIRQLRYVMGALESSRTMHRQRDQFLEASTRMRLQRGPNFSSTPPNANDNFNERDVSAVMSWGGALSSDAVLALRRNVGNMVNDILELEAEVNIDDNFNERDVSAVMSQGRVSRPAAIRLLRGNAGDMVGAIMGLVQLLNANEEFSEGDVALVMTTSRAPRPDVVRALRANAGDMVDANLELGRSPDLVNDNEQVDEGHVTLVLPVLDLTVPLNVDDEFSEEDVATVMDQTRASRFNAVRALREEAGDVAIAVIDLRVAAVMIRDSESRSEELAAPTDLAWNYDLVWNDDFGEEDITLIMQQGGVSRSSAIRTLRGNSENINNVITELRPPVEIEGGDHFSEGDVTLLMEELGISRSDAVRASEEDITYVMGQREGTSRRQAVRILRNMYGAARALREHAGNINNTIIAQTNVHTVLVASDEFSEEDVRTVMGQRTDVPRIGAIRVLRRFHGDAVAAVRYLTRYHPSATTSSGPITSSDINGQVGVWATPPDPFNNFFGPRAGYRVAAPQVLSGSSAIIAAAVMRAASSNATMTGIQFQARFQPKPDKIYPKPWPDEPKSASVYMDACAICLTRGACCLPDGCGHLCMCVECSLELSQGSIDLQRCPKCRADYTRIIRTWREAGE